MEDANTLNSGGVMVVGSDAPSEFHVAPRTTNENPAQVTGSASSAVPVNAPPVSVTPPPVSVTPPPVSVTPPPPPPSEAAGASGATTLKKKRGRPRKYAPDGSLAMPLSPKPISSAPPPAINFSSAPKRGKVRSFGSGVKVQVSGMENEVLGDWISCTVTENFTPHIITVNAGEDVTMKVISFCLQGPRTICILSAIGLISSVTLRHHDASGGTLTYEGWFDILALNGSFKSSEMGGMRNRSGGMNVSLVSPDGSVVGGAVTGLVAASPVQIVVGSFSEGNQLGQKSKKKKKKSDSMSIIAATSVPISSSTGMDGPGDNVNTA